jgi:hypothetical protein
MKENPIGTLIPVRATTVERRIFALRDLIEVDRPPNHVRIRVFETVFGVTYPHRLRELALDSRFAE